MHRLAFLAVLPLLALAACDSNALADRTYPTPGTYPASPVPALYTVPEGRYNIEAFVGSIERCPEGAACLVPDHFVALEHLHDDPPQLGAMVVMDQPDQLRVGDFYLFSVEVASEPGPARDVALLGWIEAERLE